MTVQTVEGRRSSVPATAQRTPPPSLLTALAAMPADHPSPGRPARPHHRGLAPPGQPPRPPLQRPRRAHRRPTPDRRRRPDQSRRQVRPRPRRRLRRLRHPHHHRRTQAPLPRPHLGHPGAPPPAGTAPGHLRGQQHAAADARPLPDGHRHRRPPQAHRGRGPRRPRRRPRLQRRLAVHPHRRRRARHRTRRPARLRGQLSSNSPNCASRSAPALATLDEREQKILTLRFYGNLTQSQIADQIGVSQMHVSRLLARALTKLRGQLGDSVLTDARTDDPSPRRGVVAFRGPPDFGSIRT